nr:sensor domain-containing protein [Psychromicrobium silvestre]
MTSQFRQTSEREVQLGFFGRLGRNLAYCLASFFLGIPAFVAVVALFSLGVSTAIIYGGIFVLLGTLYAASFFATAERRLAAWSREPLPLHLYKTISAPGLRGVLLRLTDSLRWREAIHAVVAFPIRITVFCLALCWLVAGPGMLTAFFWKRFLPSDSQDIWDLIGFPVSLHGWLDAAVGLFFLLTLPAVLKGLASLQWLLARGLLSNQSAVWKAKATQLEASRNSAVAAEAGNLRRIERDIHDGPQQRLVRVSMDLKSAQRRLERGEAGAAELVAEALVQTQDTLNELRAISRGIAPPILVDRGLAAAIEAAAARTPILVSVQTEGLEEHRLPENVENTAYFLVTEALTNVAKHANARRATVEVRVLKTALAVSVRDNGDGGAHLGKGHGLAGLAERVEASGGVLTVDSSAKGTLIAANLPLP